MMDTLTALRSVWDVRRRSRNGGPNPRPFEISPRGIRFGAKLRHTPAEVERGRCSCERVAHTIDAAAILPALRGGFYLADDVVCAAYHLAERRIEVHHSCVVVVVTQKWRNDRTCVTVLP